MDYGYNLQIIAIIHALLYNLRIIGIKTSFKLKLSEFCEDPRGAHQFFFQICGLFYNLWIIVIIHRL